MATEKYLYVDQGSDYSTVVQLTNNDQTDFNLTGYTYGFQIRKSSYSTVAYTANAYSTAPTTGNIILDIPASLSSTMEAGKYVFDVEMTKGSAPYTKTRVVQGNMWLSGEITK